MQIKRAVERVPGGLMVVPLLLGALLNTIDQAHLAPVEEAVKWIGIEPSKEGHFEFLGIGGFTGGLIRGPGVITLIALFLVCVGSQMNFRIGGRAIKKGFFITGTKLVVAIAVGWAIGLLFDPFGRPEHGAFLGLSVVAVIAALSNGNGGLYAALTGQYGNRSDVGALSLISFNDGPFFTLAALAGLGALGVLGASFPMVAFLAVLLPMLVGFVLGNLDPDMRKFLAHGEVLTIPFFAFALGTTMNLWDFLNVNALVGGLFLGVVTVLLTGPAAAVMLRLAGERSVIAGIAEGSTAGNATQTPIAVAVAATAAASQVGREAAEAARESLPEAAALAARAAELTEQARLFESIKDLATAQVSISTITTALLCPLAVILVDRWQRSRGIDARLERPTPGPPLPPSRESLDEELERAYEHTPTDVPIEQVERHDVDRS